MKNNNTRTVQAESSKFASICLTRDSKYGLVGTDRNAIVPGIVVYYVNVQTVRKIAQIFVAFSEKLNFNGLFSIPFNKLP